MREQLFVRLAGARTFLDIEKVLTGENDGGDTKWPVTAEKHENCVSQKALWPRRCERLRLNRKKTNVPFYM